jgi:hypothetical protein
MSVHGTEGFPPARDVEKIARNADRARLVATVARGHAMRKVGSAAGLSAAVQSPFAIRNGDTCERRLLRDEASALVAKLVEDGRLAEPGCRPRPRG